MHAGALSSADAPGLSTAAGQLPTAVNGQGPEPVKWWQSGQAAFGAAALPAGISSANAFYSGQDVHDAEQPAAPGRQQQPKPLGTRSVSFPLLSHNGWCCYNWALVCPLIEPQ